MMFWPLRVEPLPTLMTGKPPLARMTTLFRLRTVPEPCIVANKVWGGPSMVCPLPLMVKVPDVIYRMALLGRADKLSYSQSALRVKVVIDDAEVNWDEVAGRPQSASVVGLVAYVGTD